MIPFDYITEGRAEVPWTMEAQVEQDLILSRAVVSMFAESEDAASYLQREILPLLPGESWRGGE